MQCGECSTATYPATFALQCQLLSLQKFASFVWLLWWIPLLFPLCCSCLLISFSLSKKINKYKNKALITSTWHRAQAAISACSFSVRDSSLLPLYFPEQWRICLSHRPWTEYCRALQFHALTTDKSFCLAGHESSRAEWPHSVAVAPDVGRLHPLKLGMHLCCLEIPFYLHAILGKTFEKKEGPWRNKSSVKYTSNCK